MFSHAAASFEPRETSVLIWTRLTGATKATWSVARDPQMDDVIATGEATTGRDKDFTITVDVKELEAGTSYW